MPTCALSGRDLSQPETFVNLIDGEICREDNEVGDDWRPVGREHAQALRDRGIRLAGLVTPL